MFANWISPEHRILEDWQELRNGEQKPRVLLSSCIREILRAVVPRQRVTYAHSSLSAGVANIGQPGFSSLREVRGRRPTVGEGAAVRDFLPAIGVEIRLGVTMDWPAKQNLSQESKKIVSAGPKTEQCRRPIHEFSFTQKHRVSCCKRELNSVGRHFQRFHQQFWF